VRVYAIFGFCGIHNFKDINQKLGNDVLVFVNRIAEIVHSRYCYLHIVLFCSVLFLHTIYRYLYCFSSYGDIAKYSVL